jgi:hypothetical protein
MDGWDIAIWSVAAYVAVFTLVRFMGARRKLLLADLERRAAAEASRAAAVDTPSDATSK